MNCKRAQAGSWMRTVGTAQDAAQREGLHDMHPQAAWAASARELVADTAGRVRGAVEETAVAGRAAIERELSPKAAGDDGGNASNAKSELPSAPEAADAIDQHQEDRPTTITVRGRRGAG